MKSPVLKSTLPSLNDAAGDCVPEHLPPVVDGHVHIFPDSIFDSIWQWFDRYGWPIRYKLPSTEIIQFLLSHGIKHIVALHYAHKPGIARMLNDYMADLCRKYDQVTGMATVYPGENDASAILQEAFKKGLKGVKLHCHVQCFDMNSAAMDDIYETCVLENKPLIMHVGREPKSPAYTCDPYELCSSEKLELVLKTYPTLKICVPHLGADEFDAYGRLIETYDNLWLDTTMTLGDYLPFEGIPDLADLRSDRIIFGTDFPNLPYAWDREIRKFAEFNLPEETNHQILYLNALNFYAIQDMNIDVVYQENNNK